MANFNTHLIIASAASAGAALVAVGVHLITTTDALWFIFLGAVGGMLPDIDSNNSRPVKLLFNVLALMCVVAMLHIFKDSFVPYRLLLLAVVTYLIVRYGVFALFNSLTVHRGVFHSLLAAVFFAFLMTCVSYYFLHSSILLAWLNGVFIAFGFVVHLLLDEIYSVDLSNTRMKKSFGTALKLFNYDNITVSVLMTLCTIALYLMTPSLTPLGKVLREAYRNDYFKGGIYEIIARYAGY